MRLNNGLRKNCQASDALTWLNMFHNRYKNIGISGYNYSMFATRETNKPFFLNTHVYSGMLITNNIPFRWRLKYNEDVDLCLQVLNTKKLCTVSFNSFLITKVSTTAKMKGGNQTELYKGNKYELKVLKAKSLEKIWPQYVKTVLRFNRPHHQVSWKKYFKQGLVKI